MQPLPHHYVVNAAAEPREVGRSRDAPEREHEARSDRGDGDRRGVRPGANRSVPFGWLSMLGAAVRVLHASLKRYVTPAVECHSLPPDWFAAVAA